MTRAASDPLFAPASQPRLSLRMSFPGGMLFGPGKADLLEHIAATGSISAAGRAMGMSYKRAWMLVEALNAGFAQPLVESARGGPGGGGAALTAAGEEVLRRYRNVVAAMAGDPSGDIAALMQMVAPQSSAPELAEEKSRSEATAQSES